MCGPIVTAFSLTPKSPNPWHQVYFHGLLNLSRIISYALVGMAIAAVSSTLALGGHLAGAGSLGRQIVAVMTGSLLILIGLSKLNPTFLQASSLYPPPVARLHTHLSHWMSRVSEQSSRLTPVILGLLWGLIPCGFLYVAQLRAADAPNFWQGGLIMVAFGLGTLPAMLGVGLLIGKANQKQRSQINQLGGLITIIIGCLTLARGGDMVDVSGYGSLLCLVLTLIARPISSCFSGLLTYRRLLGVTAFILAVVHVLHMVVMGWNLSALPFLLPSIQLGTWAGILALLGMMPLAFTSSNWAQVKLQANWRKLHLLSIPIFILAVIHLLLVGTSFLGGFNQSSQNIYLSLGVSFFSVLVLLVRRRFLWSLFNLGKFYVPATER